MAEIDLEDPESWAQYGDEAAKTLAAFKTRNTAAPAASSMQAGKEASKAGRALLTDPTEEEEE